MMMIKNTTQWLSMALFNNKNMFAFLEPLLQKPFPAYSVKKYRAKVMQVRDENKEVYTLVLKVNRLWKGFKAGQFVELVVEQSGAKISRFFSISSSPNLFKSHRLIEITIQKQMNGRITPWLCETLKVGQYLSVSSAKGEFSICNKTKPLLLIAAGSGITPFRSMLAGYSHETDVQLMYYAKDSQHLFVKELKDYEKSNKHISVAFMNSSEKGRISQNHLQAECPDFTQRQVYICGPGPMIESSKQLLLNNNMSVENVHYEYFGAKPVEEISTDIAGVVSFERSTIKAVVNINSKNTLLELAESSGLKPVTGCRMGICHQCICQKKQGVVYNTLTKTYSDTGYEEVQLCVSVPVGDVSINL